MKKLILDACCGGRFFWFQKQHPRTLYIDIRREEPGVCPERKNFCVQPDAIMDFRELPFKNNTFKLIVWDPPPSLKFIPERNNAKEVWDLEPRKLARSYASGLQRIMARPGRGRNTNLQMVRVRHPNERGPRIIQPKTSIRASNCKARENNLVRVLQGG